MTAAGITITNGAAIAFAICAVSMLAGLALVLYQQDQLQNERSERQRQDRAAFILNCRNREREIDKINRRLGLPPSGVKCSTLPVFNKQGR